MHMYINRYLYIHIYLCIAPHIHFPIYMHISEKQRDLTLLCIHIFTYHLRRVIYRGRPDSTNVKCPYDIGRDGWVREGADILNNSPHKVGVEASVE